MKNQEYEIDLIEILKLFGYNWIKIAACTIVCAIIGFIFTVSKPKVYTATARFNVSPLSSTLSSSQNSVSTSNYTGDPNSLLGSDLTVDSSTDIISESVGLYSSFSDAAKVAAYAGEIIKSDIVLQPVIDALSLNTTCNTLASSISAEATGSGPILQVEVTQSEADDALSICEKIVDYAPSLIMSTTDISDIAAISEASVAPKATRSPMYNAALGAMLGFVLAVGLLLIRYLTNSFIYKEEDIINMLGIKVLGIIPAAKETNNNV